MAENSLKSPAYIQSNVFLSLSSILCYISCNKYNGVLLMNRENLISPRREKKGALNEALKSLDQKTAALWAADCAEHVLPLFESEYQDLWPEKAVGAARGWARGEISVKDAREAAFGAHGAARDAGDGAAGYAARAAGHAAASAHVKGHAIHAADYAVKAAAAASGDPEKAAEKEREWQHIGLLKAAGK